MGCEWGVILPISVCVVFFCLFFFFKLSFHLTFLTMHSVGMSIKPSSGVMRCSCAVTLGLFLPLSAQEGDFRALRN